LLLQLVFVAKVRQSKRTNVDRAAGDLAAFVIACALERCAMQLARFPRETLRTPFPVVVLRVATAHFAKRARVRLAKEK
jgi:hypothetical protein